MQIATWGTCFFKADAQKCADEIMEICEELESAATEHINKEKENCYGK